MDYIFIYYMMLFIFCVENTKMKYLGMFAQLENPLYKLGIGFHRKSLQNGDNSLEREI